MLSFGEERQQLLNELQQRIPRHARIEALHEHPLTHSILARLSNPSGELSIPLDIIGTPFQLRVWKVLCDIPVGSTLSYLDVAKKIGNNKAARAVARACAANPVPIIIPCHRVIHQKGSLSGYRFGSKMKSELLKHEATHSTS